jgi:hypothetical protein
LANADKVEDLTFIKQIDESEIENLQIELKNESVSVMKLRREQKNKMAEMKAELKPHVNRVHEITEKLEKGGEEVTEKVYKMTDPQNNVVLYYDQRGKLVLHRPIKEKTAENQLRVFAAASNS